MRLFRRSTLPAALPAALLLAPLSAGQGQGPDTLGLGNGFIDFQTGSFAGKIVRDTQILVSLSPASNESFDFLPFDYMPWRAANGNNHIGDVNFRYRLAGTTAWVQGSTATARQPIRALGVSGGEIASSNLAPTLNASLPLDFVRTWSVDGDDLTLIFAITNTHNTPVEIGALGFPIENNNIFSNRSQTDVEANCSFADPYIGLDAGYVQLTRVSGLDPAVAVTPVGSTPLEAWNFLFEDNGTSLHYQSNEFEGYYEWDVHSLALAEQEWPGAEPWNPPTSRVLQPGEAITHGLRFSLSPRIEDVEDDVAARGIPLATGYPGLVVPADLTARLVINYTFAVLDITQEPAGAFQISPSAAGHDEYILTADPSAWGRVRVTITYQDGKVQTVHYNIVKSGPQVLTDLGSFMSDHHWYANKSDDFGRGPSFMLVDHDTDDLVLQEFRVWLVGLCHEAGASWMVAAIKQIAQPNAEQLSKLEQFVEGVLWRNIEEEPSYAVPYSLFWYSPNLTDFQYSPSQPWQPGDSYSWPRDVAERTNRAYGYVYPATAYWALYRAARSLPELLPRYTWDFYLGQAFETLSYCFSAVNGTHPVDFWDAGLMGETVIAEILKDLQREGWASEAANLTSLMQARAAYWDSIPVPFGSEQPWDCTGQEGVYYWSNYFNYTATVTKTLQTIRGYMPAIAHWGYNGNARRYWDFIDGGAPQTARIERQIHHYGSGLNALPLMHHLRTSLTSAPAQGKKEPALAQAGPDTWHLLRLAFAGSFAPLTNVQADGFGSAAFHAYPQTLAWDAYSGDYGPGFVGLMLGAATYVVQSDAGDLTVWGGNLVQSSVSAPTAEASYEVVPRDAVRMRVFIGPLGLWIEIDAGSIESVRVQGHAVTVAVVAGVNADTARPASAVIWVENVGGGGMEPVGLQEKRGGWAFDLQQGSAVIRIQ